MPSRLDVLKSLHQSFLQQIEPYVDPTKYKEIRNEPVDWTDACFYLAQMNETDFPLLLQLWGLEAYITNKEKVFKIGGDFLKKIKSIL